jgi:hypothetical protein
VLLKFEAISGLEAAQAADVFKIGLFMSAMFCVQRSDDLVQ